MEEHKNSEHDVHNETGVVNGQPFQPIASSQFSPNDEQKPSRWRYFFIVLGVLQALGVALFFLIYAWAVVQSRSGVSGMEFIVLIMLFTLVPAVGVIALMNLIGLPIFMVKRRSHGKMLVLGIMSLLVSLLLVSYAAFNMYQMYVVPKQLSQERREKYQQEAKEFAADNTNSEITKEEAIQLLKSCELKGFYYTNQTEVEELDGVKFPSADSSATGIVLIKIGGKPHRIRIADRLVAELVPIAREAQRTCGKPQFWHDGNYEQYKDGKWYFGNEVVNNTRAGKSKDYVVNLMRDCKVDYFVGYTGDLNVVKDGNTRDWLSNAEKSDSGIEASEEATKTYVFASKAMTAELQNTAKQFRQACYNKKKLYIMIDDWLETEYPAGTWTRVKQ